MGSSAIAALRELILEVVRYTARDEWKVLVLDEGSQRLVDTVAKEDDFLKEKVTNVARIEQQRPGDPGLDALYLLSPKAYVVDCLIADLERRKHRRTYLIWTSLLPIDQRQRIDSHPSAREQIALFKILNVDFFPRESNLITFRDPWSFPILFHPGCDGLVQNHLRELTQKIISICVSLGEYPTIRYHRPRNPIHSAGVLCSHLARFVQEGLDQYANYNEDFPAPSPRPRGVLVITDRAMDLFAPLIHEFTYQAMVHELLPVKEGDKTLYKTVFNKGSPNEEEREMELGENDKIWLENRHLHMKDLLTKLVEDFRKFKSENPQFAESTAQPNTINNIKDMIAGLPEFREGKDMYALHLNMAQECMDVFQKCKLPEVATVEQSMATGLDEDFKKPKNLTDQLVRLLDEDAIPMPDRLRLIMQYVLYRDGIFESDTEKLLAHAQLPSQEREIVGNLSFLGARTVRDARDQKPPPPPLFARNQVPSVAPEELSLSRFEPAVKDLLQELLRGTLDQSIFPYTKPLLDGSEAQVNVSQSSLRSAKPTWARTRPSAMESRQRIIVFVAGGATYSESRACYEVSRSHSKDVYMASSHMLTPNFFLRQVGDLSVDRRRLDLPADRPPRKAPAHIFEREGPPQSGSLQPPAAGLANMTLQSGGASRHGNAPPPAAKYHPLPSPKFTPESSVPSKPSKDPKEKKRGFFKF